MKKFIKLFTNKIILSALFFLVEVALIVLLSLYVSQFSIWVYIALHVLTVIVTVAVMSRDSNPAYKLALIIPMLTFSSLGGLIYLCMGRPRIPRRKLKKMQSVGDTVCSLLSQTEAQLAAEPDGLDGREKKLSDYIRNDALFPLYDGNEVEYFPSGETYYAALVEALKKAERYIFLEYFIIEPGKFWNDVSTVLIEKVSAGVDVRVIYDDVGSVFTLPRREKKRLTAAGIRLMAFNKLTPSFDIRLNNRSHRKIAVIDGEVAFTGGVNLADEYINAVERCGHWKDTGIKITGTAAWSFTVMFCSFWAYGHPDQTEDYAALAPIHLEKRDCSGYVQPFADKPGQNLQLSENAILHVINEAKDYVYIDTPYLILDNELVSMLCLAAKSGVDVRITVPHVPDKRTILMMTRSFYPPLIAAGVKIYEYTPGFLHAKSIVSDDKIAYVGSCNLDYRSLYLHFECGAMLYDCPCIADIKNDYLQTLDLSEQISLKKARGANIFVRLYRSILRIFAPLL